MYLAEANSLTLKKAAIFYAERGYRVFPLNADSKIPVKGLPWKQAATTDTDVIEHWWSTYPKSNIGLLLGVESGVNCLDVDRKKGCDGFVSLAALTQDEYLGPIQGTPSGGEHRFYVYEPGFSNWTKKGVSGGLDMRTDAGYIVVAPSVLPHGIYSWSRECDVPEANTQLRIAFQTWTNQRDVVDSDSPGLPGDLIDYRTLVLKDRYLDYLETGNASPWETDEGIDESAVIFSVAGALMRELQDEAQVFGIMVANPHVMACAERHRTQGNPTDWLWKYGIGNIVRDAKKVTVSDVFSPLAASPTIVSPQPKELQPWEYSSDASEDIPQYDPPEDGFFIRPSEGFAHYLKQTKWLVQGLLEEDQIGALYGPSGSFKTFLALDMCLHISLGLSWHGKVVWSPGYCAFVTSEGLNAVWKRVEAWRLAYNRRNESSPTHTPVSQTDIDKSGFVISKCGVDLLDVATLTKLNDYIHSVGTAPSMIVFDTLASNMQGNENSTEDMTRLVNQCKSARAAYGCNAMLVHHTGHSDTGRMRGASALYAGLDYVLQVSKQKNADMTVDLKSTKSKDSALMKPLSFDLEVQRVDIVEQDGSMATSLVPKLAVQTHEHVSMEKQRALNAKQARVLNTVLDMVAKGEGSDEVLFTPDEIHATYYHVHEADTGKLTRLKHTENTLSVLISGGHLMVDLTKKPGTWIGKVVSSKDEES